MLLCPGATETNFFEAAEIGADRKTSFSTKVLETSEQVVDSAMEGIKKKKIVTVSGLQNKIGRYVLHFIPNTIALPVYEKQMRGNLKL